MISCVFEFKCNRIQKIKSTTDPKQWHIVKSEDNPADHASRGLMADQLVAFNWFTVPDFLWENEVSMGYEMVGGSLTKFQNFERPRC